MREKPKIHHSETEMAHAQELADKLWEVSVKSAKEYSLRETALAFDSFRLLFYTRYLTVVRDNMEEAGHPPDAIAQKVASILEDIVYNAVMLGAKIAEDLTIASGLTEKLKDIRLIFDEDPQYIG